MSNAMLNIYVRVINKRITDCEDLETILSEYTKLSDEEKIQIRERIEG